MLITSYRKTILTTVSPVKSDMLERQRMEAASLASTHMLERGSKAPELAVSFPFPEIFDQVKLSTMKYLSGV